MVIWCGVDLIGDCHEWRPSCYYNELFTSEKIISISLIVVKGISMGKKKKKVVYLGLDGSFSHEAAMQKFPTAEMLPKDTLEDVFATVFAGQADYAIMPVENSTEGIVSLTYHLLVEQGTDPKVKVCGEIYHPIEHHLGAISQVSLDSIKFVHTKEEAWGQCRTWVVRNLPSDLQFVAESSTSHAAKVVAKSQEPERVVIASSLAIEIFGLIPIVRSIPYLMANTTRFFILKRKPRQSKQTKRPHKVTFGMVLHDRIGAISDSFSMLSRNNIDVRSVKVSPIRAPEVFKWRDWFFVDALTPDRNPEVVLSTLELMRQQKELILTIRELGCYPSGEAKALPTRVSIPPPEFPSMPNNSKKLGSLSLEDLIAMGEGPNIEFKSSLRWNYKEARIDKNLELVIVKTVVGFMNAKGGVLLIGVDDAGNFLGIEKDYETIRKPSKDGFELHLRNKIESIVGAHLGHTLEVRFYSRENKDICLLAVKPSPIPVWIERGEEPDFYVRSGNQTKPLNRKEVAEYMKFRWGS